MFTNTARTVYAIPRENFPVVGGTRQQRASSKTITDLNRIRPVRMSVDKTVQ